MSRLLLLLLLGCSGSEPRKQGDPAETGAEDSADVETTDTADRECGWGFAEDDAPWALPSTGEDHRMTEDLLCSGDDDELHRLVDMDGDEALDLVRVFDCSRTTELGNSEWRVHRNTGEGFATEAESWSLPALAESHAWSSASDDVCERSVDHIWALEDLDGDDRPDLVVLSDCDSSTDIGVGRWQVWKNNGAGFDAEPIDWAVPAEPTPDGWKTLRAHQCSGEAAYLLDLVDLDGDGDPELIATSPCGEEPQPFGVGSWRVWRNNGDGFSTASEDWALPDVGGDGWPLTAGHACTGEQDHVHELMDFNADGLPDLVVTSACDDDPAWDEAWQVFPGTGDGFGPAEPWTLPPEDTPGAWQQPFERSCIQPDKHLLLVEDLNGDEIPDLARLGDCRRDSVPRAWELHWGESGGFSAEPEPWTLPFDDEGGSWTVMYDDMCNTTGDSLFAVMDLDGDDIRDVVTTYACDPETEPGSSSWRVRRGGCSLR